MKRRIVVIGDDFTPAQVLAGAIRERAPGEIELSTLDLDQAPFNKGPVEGVREFLGSPEAFLDQVEGAHALVTTFAPITARVLERAPALELICCGRGGPVNVDVEAATARGIPVAFAPGRNAEAVAEFVLGLVVAVTRRLLPAAAYLRAGEWTDGREDTFAKPSGPELEGRVLGIVGFGAIGSRVAELVGPLRMRVLAHDPLIERETISAAGVQPAALDELLESAEVVTVHARPPSGGEPLLGARELGLMRPGSYLINTSRGGALSEPALLEALRSGRLAGAALDVLAAEPIEPDSPLLAEPNLILTPHSAGVSHDVPRRTAAALAEAIARWLRGEPLLHVANPEALAGGA